MGKTQIVSMCICILSLFQMFFPQEWAFDWNWRKEESHKSINKTTHLITGLKTLKFSEDVNTGFERDVEIDEMEKVKVGSQMQVSVSTYMPVYFFHRAAVYFSMRKTFWKKMGTTKFVKKLAPSNVSVANRNLWVEISLIYLVTGNYRFNTKWSLEKKMCHVVL